MIEKFNNFIINEKMDIDENNTIKISILFTDIVDSSELWLENKKDMIKSLEEQSKRMDIISEKYNGTIIKTIGDAYMMAFVDFEKSIECGINIQEDLLNNPIKINNKNIKLRCGICYGNVYETYSNIQNNRLVDYLGNVVNSASRIESKVCKPGNVVFSSLDKNIKKIDNLLSKYEVDIISFNDDGEKEVKRSSRLLTDVQRYYYKDIDELKGIKKIDVYQIKIK